MGCDIHSRAEVRKDGKWEQVGYVFPLDDFDRDYYKREFGNEPFTNRSYGLFAFLAGVRNYSGIEPISEPKGMPEDASLSVRVEAEDDALHSHSWLTLAELLAVDYDKEIWDRRYTKQTGPNFWDGGATAELHETELGTRETLREFLGERYFQTLEVLKGLGLMHDVRVVFWFDN